MSLYPSKKYYRLIILNIVFILAISLILADRSEKINEQIIQDIRVDTLTDIKEKRNIEGVDIVEGIENKDLEEVYEIADTMEKNIDIRGNFLSNEISAFLIVSIIFLLMQLFNIMFMKVWQKNYINSIDKFINSIIDKKFNVQLREDDESINSNLNNRINKLGLAVKRNYYSLNDERVKLQNALDDISHQIKTPLSAIRIYNEILLDSDNLDQQQIEFINLSDQQVSRLNWLISSLLKISRFEAEAIEMNPTDFKVSNLSQNLEETLLDKLRSKNLKIIEKGDTEETVKLDFKWTQEALVNIVKNASEHAYNNSEIVIDYTVNVSMIRIDITNKGDNIPSDDVTKIFTRFYKSKLNNNPESVGIGLNLSKKIIEQQYGTITVQNIQDGVTFSILFLK